MPYRDEASNVECRKHYRETHRAELAAAERLAYAKGLRKPWKDRSPTSKLKVYASRIRRSREIKLEVLSHYGSKCACCGESRLEFLCMDHINGGGSKHRKSRKFSTIYRWLLSNNYPPGFRVLCHNCNMSLGLYGYCPHKEERDGKKEAT